MSRRFFGSGFYLAYPAADQNIVVGFFEGKPAAEPAGALRAGEFRREPAVAVAPRGSSVCSGAASVAVENKLRLVYPLIVYIRYGIRLEAQPPVKLGIARVPDKRLEALLVVALFKQRHAKQAVVLCGVQLKSLRVHAEKLRREGAMVRKWEDMEKLLTGRGLGESGAECGEAPNQEN